MRDMRRYIVTFVKKNVTLFSHVGWLNAMKVGTVRSLANRHLLSEFGELWPTFRCLPGLGNICCWSVGHAFIKINEVRRQLSHIDIMRGRNLAHW